MSNGDLHLLNCIRASLRGTLSRNDIQELFGETVEWDRLLNDAQLSGTAPLLYYILKEADADSLLPERVVSKLEIAYYSNFTHNTAYYKDLSDILTSFQRSDIHAIILKGAALAEILYPDISLRPFVDIDLLIRDQDMPKAKDELQHFGYVENVTKEFHQGYRREFDKHFAYSKSGHIPVYVELHTSLLSFVNAQKLVADGLWERAVVAQIGEVHGLVLSAEDMVLHLCMHIFNHYLSTKLIWSYDVALMLLKHGKSIDWNLLKKRARALGVYRVVGLALDQVSQRLDVPVPQDAVSWLKSSRLSFIEKLFIINRAGLMIWRYTLRLRLAKSMKAKLMLVGGQLFPSRDYIMRMYSISNRWLVFFGYCCHLISQSQRIGINRILRFER